MSGIEGARRINTNYGMPVFSRIEIRDISIAVIVLTIAFTLIFRRYVVFSNDPTTNLMCWVATSFVLVIMSFILHEFGHKFTAQRFGAWSEFRVYPTGLILCLVMSVFGFLFAAPGAVYIRGYITDEMNGKISLAGPAVNIVIAAISLSISLWMMDGISGYIFFLMGYMNSFLALFNLLPIPPLDGSKIMVWNVYIYVAMLIIAGLLLVATYIIW